MASIQNVTRAAILEAIKECDTLGEAAFLAKHGYGKSAKFVLRHNGKDYPSKAIVGAAAELSAKEFSGGRATVEKLLTRHGFRVEQLMLGFMAGLAVAASVATAPEAVEQETTVSDGAAIYFASGSNRASDIRGFAAIGHAIGVAAPDVSPNAENELHELAGTGIPVFLDSGAFSEVDKTNPTKVVKPITEAQWQKRLDLANRLAATLGEQLHVVAPDQVANQKVTLERLTRYAPELRALRSQGAHILVAIQRGELSQAEFDRRVEAILGFGDYTRALPMKKSATSTKEVRAFVKARKPARIHLLGMGIKNRLAEETLATIAKVTPDAVVTMDSNLIAASVGRQAAEPRLLTRARDMATKLINAGKTAIKSAQELGIILAFGTGGFQLALGVA